jgi:uncharacterized protein YggT (Ycf19 family)
VDIIDFILNVACLLLWFNWRGARFDPLTASKPATLTGTLRRAEPMRFGRWLLPAALVTLLFVRALFYRQLGPAIKWTPYLDFGVVSLAFRSDRFWLMELFSALSFFRALVIFYFWLFFLSAVNGSTGATDPFQKLIRLHLGPMARWKWIWQLLLPALMATAAWMVLHPFLARAGVSRPVAIGHLALQGLIVGGGLIFTLKYLIPAFLFAHLITSYIYFGRNPFWDFVALTASNLLAPIRRLPLQLGKVDFAPLIGIILVLLLLHTLPNFILAWLNKPEINRTIWPQ